MKWKSFLLLVFFFFSNQQFQQTTFLSGTISNSPVYANYGSTDVYDEDNTFGHTAYNSVFLTLDNSEIMVFFGHRYKVGTGMNEKTDNYWKYSIDKRQWKFINGRKDNNLPPIIQNSETKVFNSENHIGSRERCSGWRNSDILTFFGGIGFIGVNQNHIINEVWMFNITSNEYAAIHTNYYVDANDNNLQASGIDLVFNAINTPSGRYSHQAIQINQNEVLLLGGVGYQTSAMSTAELADTWIFSNTLMQWKFVGGEVDGVHEIIYGETNVYHKDNTLGSRQGHTAVLINEEEILVYSGQCGTFPQGTSYIQKYNISSGYWKYVQGTGRNNFAKGFLRTYSDINIPGGREYHKIWKINEKEILIFGGNGYNGFRSGNYLNDIWLLNLEINKWMYIGKEESKYGGRYCVNGAKTPTEYSETTVIGGKYNFFGVYIMEKKELIICGGYGNNFFSGGYSDHCWSIYFGSYCNLIKDTDPNVCNRKGTCESHNHCECIDSEIKGDFCDLTKCGEYYSNETEYVCSQKGLCVDSHCLCYDQSPYNNDDCTINEELRSFMENIWVYIFVPIGIVVFVVIIVVIAILLIVLGIKLRKTTKKFEGIEDVDLILEEAKLEQKSKKPKIKINKSLFEIQFSDLKLLSVIGDGGSNSTIYLAKWKGNFCAYKGFQIHDLSTNHFSFEEFEKEVKIFSNIRHPSILQFYGACVNPPKVGIVLEYCRMGDLNNFLNKYILENSRNYEISEKIRILKEIAVGMFYLHSIGILHRDLKPENVLIDDNEHAKIMDFGLSKLTENSEKTMTKQIGTSYYMSPEMISAKGYTEKCDVYSFAVLCFVVVTENFFPYGNEVSHARILKQVSENSTFRPKIDNKDFKNCQFLKKLITKNWKTNPNERNSFKEIVEVFSNNEIKTKSIKRDVKSKRKSNSNFSEQIKEKDQSIMRLKKENQRLKEENLAMKKRISNNSKNFQNRKNIKPPIRKKNSTIKRKIPPKIPPKIPKKPSRY